MFVIMEEITFVRLFYTAISDHFHWKGGKEKWTS